MQSLLFFYNKQSFELIFNKYLIYSTILVGVVCYYRFWVITPSYNLYNLCGVILFLSGLLFKINKISFLKNYRSYSLISIGGLLTFINKPSTLLFLVLVFLIWLLIFHKKNILKFTIIYSIIGFLILLIYLKLSFSDLSSFLDDMYIGYDLIKTFDPRYSFFTLLIFSLKIILKNILLSSIFFSIQILISFSLRKLKISQRYILIFPLLSLFIYKNLLIAVISIFLYVLFTSNKNKLLKDKNIVLIVIPFLIFSYSFGTNTNIITHFQTSALLFFIFILHSLSLEISYQKIKSYFLSIFLLFVFVTNMYNNFYNPQRYQFNIFEQNQSIKVPSFQNEIYGDKFILSYVNQVSSISKKIDKDKINYLIDYTGRQPILNILFDLEFVSRPWWSGGYESSNNYVKKILAISDEKKIQQSLIITYDDENLQLLNIENLYEIGIDLDKDYKLLGRIILEKYTKNKKFNFKVWMPLLNAQSKNN